MISLYILLVCVISNSLIAPGIPSIRAATSKMNLEYLEKYRLNDRQCGLRPRHTSLGFVGDSQIVTLDISKAFDEAELSQINCYSTDFNLRISSLVDGFLQLAKPPMPVSANAQYSCPFYFCYT